MTAERILDASINRCAEGLRVLEDIARFHFNNRQLSSQFRTLRHTVRKSLVPDDNTLLPARNSINDVGKQISSREVKTDSRKDLKSTAAANCKRVQEALRSLEEILKSRSSYLQGKKAENCRFSLYTLESELLSLFTRILPAGIYGILGEKFSRVRSNIEVAEEMIKGGISIIQYREKREEKSFRKMYEECRIIRAITKEANIPFIINDFSELALMVEADGIHQGQDDLPIKELRKLAPHMMLGCSTHSPDQAEKAVEDGADYIGVGPLFPTTTKKDVCDAVGLNYLEYVARNLNIPFVAIGGIKKSNLKKVIKKGATTVCLVTEILGADDIARQVRNLQLTMPDPGGSGHL